MADVLLLNADGQPVSYLPLSAISWRSAIQYLWSDKVHVLDWYDDWMVRSPSWETQVPAVIMLKQQMKRRTKPRFSKGNVYLRDMYTCQYCEEKFGKRELTLDHVLPISRGGRTEWENIVAACNPCNSTKGNKLGIKPKRMPWAPSYWELVNNRKLLDIDVRHPSWEKFL